jgi:hypothetical protein
MVNKILTLLDMRRALVLTNEAARHPFRQNLPAFRVEPPSNEEPLTDLAFFGVSFVSWFVIIMGMIA